MIDVRLYEKINKLKERFFDADDSVKQQITQWEQDIARLSQASDFAQLPTVVNIVNVLKERLREVMTKRATGKGHTPQSLQSLEDREQEIRYCLSLFLPRYQSELESIEKIIDNELL